MKKTNTTAVKTAKKVQKAAQAAEVQLGLNSMSEFRVCLFQSMGD